VGRGRWGVVTMWLSIEFQICKMKRWIVAVLYIRASHVLGKPSATELHLQPWL
jgi:hypothetical protein